MHEFFTGGALQMTDTNQNIVFVLQDVTERHLRRKIWISAGFWLLLVGFIIESIWAFLNLSFEWWFWVAVATSIYLLADGILLAGSCIQLEASKRGILIKYGAMGVFKLFIDTKDLRSVSALPEPAGEYIRAMWRTGWIFHGAGFNIIVGNKRAEAIALICRNRRYIISCLDAHEAALAIRQLYSLPADASVPIEVLIEDRASQAMHLPG
jgi:hypothetical protein